MPPEQRADAFKEAKTLSLYYELDFKNFTPEQMNQQDIAAQITHCYDPSRPKGEKWIEAFKFKDMPCGKENPNGVEWIGNAPGTKSSS